MVLITEIANDVLSRTKVLTKKEFIHNEDFVCQVNYDLLVALKILSISEEEFEDPKFDPDTLNLGPDDIQGLIYWELESKITSNYEWASSVFKFLEGKCITHELYTYLCGQFESQPPYSSSGCGWLIHESSKSGLSMVVCTDTLLIRMSSDYDSCSAGFLVV